MDDGRDQDPWERNWRGDYEYRPPGDVATHQPDPKPSIRQRWKIVVRFLPAAVALAFLGFGWWQDWRRIDPEDPIPASAPEFITPIDTEGRCAGPGPRVCFIPIGPATEPSAGEAAAHFTAAPYLIQTDVLPPLEPPAAAVDHLRQQLVSVPLLEAIEDAFPDLAADSDVTLIGLTRYDFASGDDVSLNFVFGVTDGRAIGVISTYRMNPRNFGKHEDPELMRERAGKLLAKYVGMLHFGLAQSENADSVLYGHIRGLKSLDAIDHTELTAEELTAASSRASAGQGP